MPAKRHLISIVDDEASVRTAIATLLRSVGYQTMDFASAEELLESEHLDLASCVISDVRMLGMNGFELLSVLSERNYSIPVILISANGAERARATAINMRAFGFLGKPFDGQVLIQLVSRACS